MAWQTPKTNWKKGDYFNLSDYNRIKGNLEHLLTMCNPTTVPTMGEATIKTIPSAEFFKTIVWVTNAISADTGIPVLRDIRVLQPNEPGYDEGELNIIEGNIQILYDALKNQKAKTRTIPFKTGDDNIGI